jgi:4-hydroxythreonine-4-phosphate dehydrogenase
VRPLLVSSGEPAGIGPDLCLALTECSIPLVVLADRQVLESRANILGKTLLCSDYVPGQRVTPRLGHLTVLHVPCPEAVIPGQLNPRNASYVLQLLHEAVKVCSSNQFSALVTAPIHKANLNAAGIPFTGHTEFFAEQYQTEVVMMLICEELRVALVTTHLPLRQVPDAITIPLVEQVISLLDQSLKRDFGIERPRIKVAGLNPHAGESGYLGQEELQVITPALHALKSKGLEVEGPLSADTLFTKANMKNCDAFVAMYHDQGLPVLKYLGFHQAVNVTLGLPIIRTSVDHGTAL